MSHPFSKHPMAYGLVTPAAGGAIETRRTYRDQRVVVGHYPRHAGTGMPYRVKLVDRAEVKTLAKLKLSREGLMHLRDAANQLLSLNIEDED